MTRSHLGRRVRWVAPWLGAALLLLGALGACNYRWVAVLSTFQFKSMDVLSVFPAHRDETGNYERQCTPADHANATVNSLLYSVNLVGTEVGGTDVSTESDKDTSIRPGDLVKKGTNQRAVVQVGETISEADFRVDVECLESYPDVDLTGVAACQGVVGPRDATPQKLNYRSYFTNEYRPSASDRDAMAIAVLVDQSGSMKGFVETETDLEVMGGSSGPWDPVNFKAHASDPDGQRLTAIKSFFSLLNPNDRAGVFQFGETVGSTPKIVCDIAGAKEDDRRRDCFGANRTVVFGCTTAEKAAGCTLTGKDFTTLGVNAKGRTPLWAAVSDVYSYMKSGVGSRVRHMVVITDGPDTCHPDSPDFQPVLRQKKAGKYVEFKQDNACAETSFENFLTVLEADLKDGEGKYLPANEVPVHVSFIQFQALGYKDRDPRQQEIACRTGGHYTFINAQDLQTGTSAESLRSALLMAVQRLRGALAGAWTLAVDVPDLAIGRLPLGSELAVGGVVKLLSGDLTPDAQYDLRVGYVAPTGGQNIPGLDLRGAIRIPCAAGDSCAWYPAVDDCSSVACRGGDQICTTTQKPDDTVCGTDGACCWASCLTSTDDCKVYDALCNLVNAADLTTCATGVCCSGACTAGATCP